MCDCCRKRFYEQMKTREHYFAWWASNFQKKPGSSQKIWNFDLNPEPYFNQEGDVAFAAHFEFTVKKLLVVVNHAIREGKISTTFWRYFDQVTQNEPDSMSPRSFFDAEMKSKPPTWESCTCRCTMLNKARISDNNCTRVAVGRVIIISKIGVAFLMETLTDYIYMKYYSATLRR